MDIEAIRKVGRDLLGLELTDNDAQELVAPLAGLRQLIDDVEKVGLNFTEEPFLSPRSADVWLERWPEP
jgi:hypothetical protein